MYLTTVYCPECGKGYGRGDLNARQPCEDCGLLLTLPAMLHEARVSRISETTLRRLTTQALFARHARAEDSFDSHYRYCTRAKQRIICPTCTALGDNVTFFEQEMERRADLSARQ